MNGFLGGCNLGNFGIGFNWIWIFLIFIAFLFLRGGGFNLFGGCRGINPLGFGNLFGGGGGFNPLGFGNCC